MGVGKMRIYDSGTYRDMTESEIANMSLFDTTEYEIGSLKRQLEETDYIAIK